MGENDETFLSIGDDLVEHLRRHAGLTDTSAVLDVGCGYGRVAHALLRQEFEGTYLGFDILRPQIRWCRRNLATERIRFRHLDVRNDRYNPEGSIEPSQLVLKAPRASFDVVLAASVFTHMWPDEIQRYFHVIANKLRPGGHAYLTFFLLNRSWKRQVRSTEQHYELKHRHGRIARFMRPDKPLHVIAYRQRWVERELRRALLQPEQVLLGSWCGRPGTSSFQDVIVARRGPVE